MRRIRLHSQQALAAGQAVDLEPGPARHLVRVLRQRVGQPVTLFNGDGDEYNGEIIEVRGADHCRVHLTEALMPAVESPLKITLVQAIARGERMDWAIQKAVEMGVSAICPVSTERTEVKLSAKRADKRLIHWQQVMTSACEQSGRVRVPEITPPQALDQIEAAPGLNLVLDPEAARGPGQLEPPQPEQVQIVIGPEGGLSDRELAMLIGRGFTGLRLGPRVLRTETAGAATLAMLQTLFGDWQ
jgi:16S rRNA (uracil1498-N3)-methyltransferase